MFLPSGVILPLRLTGGAIVDLESMKGSWFKRRLYSIAQRADPKILRDRVDRGTLAPQMEPEDVYSQF